MHWCEQLYFGTCRFFLEMRKHPQCSVTQLTVVESGLADENVTFLGAALAVNKTPKSLNTCQNGSIASWTGWEQCSKCLRNPNSSTWEHHDVNIDDDGAYVNVPTLADNSSLKELQMLENYDITNSIWAL